MRLDDQGLSHSSKIPRRITVVINGDAKAVSGDNMRHRQHWAVECASEYNQYATLLKERNVHCGSFIHLESFHFGRNKKDKVSSSQRLEPGIQRVLHVIVNFRHNVKSFREGGSFSKVPKRSNWKTFWQMER